MLKFLKHVLPIAAFLSAAGLHAAVLKVVATTPDLADVARKVGGDKVAVDVLSKGFQDPHFVDAKPSLIMKLMSADLFIETGLELEIGWAPLLVQGARNPVILPGNKGFLDASQVIRPLEVPLNVSRAGGDIHPGGNPHYMTDPENARLVARLMADKFSALSPGDAAVFRANLKAFEAALDQSLKTWKGLMAPHKGAKFVSFHKNMLYFAARFGLEEAGEIEPKPGIPPTASHTADLIALMQSQKVPLILTQPYYERRTPDSLARATGAKVVVFSMAPDGGSGGADYLATMDGNVQAVVRALSGK